MTDLGSSAAEAEAERRIALEGAVNFRDLGGYATGDGRRTRWRTLFRADGLGDLTAADLEVLRDLGIRTVVDLRSGDELERGRLDVDAHPVAFHHFLFIETLPDRRSTTVRMPRSRSTSRSGAVRSPRPSARKSVRHRVRMPSAVA